MRMIAIQLQVLLILGCGNHGISGDAGDEEALGEPSEDTSIDRLPDGSEPCRSDVECDNGLFCDGAETCSDEGTCEGSTQSSCDDGNPCTLDSCDEDADECVIGDMDEDGDGSMAAHAPTGEECGGPDCDDADESVHPGAFDGECDLVDKNCDDSTGEYIDDDGDGWIDWACDGVISDPGPYDGMGDCDDASEDIHPGAPEGCDGIVDHDCDGDETDLEADSDSDGYPPPSCGGTDCDDTDGSVHPGASESCDPVDQDCDGSIMDAAGIDSDSDGVPDASCSGNDCDDEDVSVHGSFTPPSGVTDPAVPGSTEICDTIDQDCDGTLLDALDADDDGDTVLDELCGGMDCDDADSSVRPGAPEGACDTIDNDCDGDAIDGIADDDGDDFLDDLCSEGNDCDDTDASVHPGAMEVCDTIDQDCDGILLDALDADDDGDTVLDESCGGLDCEDSDPLAYPGAPEICDAIDQDCDGSWSEAGADTDGDTVLDAACGGTDCNDLNPAVHPGSTLICDAVDNDCSGSWRDEPDADDDGDTVLDDFCTGGTDCDDTDGTIFPGALEVCGDGVDQNCNGTDSEPSPKIASARITDGPGMKRHPWLSWTGSQFGVSWDDSRSGMNDIYFARISSEGIKLGSDVRITDTGDHSWLPSLAWTGSEFGLCWEDERHGDSELYFIRLSDSGVISGTETRITNATGSTALCRLQWTGSELGVGFSDTRDGNSEIYFARLSPLGVKVGSDVRITVNGASSDSLSLAWTGSQFGVSWMDTRDGSTNYEIYFARISAAGSKVGTDVRITNDSYLSMVPSLLWTGTEFGVAWGDSRSGGWDVYFARITAGGTKVGSDVRITNASGRDEVPSLAWAGSEFGVSWQSERDGQYDVFFALISATGAKMGSDVRIEYDANDSEDVSLAWTGSEFGVSWWDYRRVEGEQIYFNLVSICP